MQDLISQVEDLAGIEIDHTTSMVMISFCLSSHTQPSEVHSAEYSHISHTCSPHKPS